MGRLGKLEELYLGNTQVTDEDLEQLHGVLILLMGTQVSEDGLNSLGKRTGPANTAVIVP